METGKENHTQNGSCDVLMRPCPTFPVFVGYKEMAQFFIPPLGQKEQYGSCFSSSGLAVHSLGHWFVAPHGEMTQEWQPTLDLSLETTKRISRHNSMWKLRRTTDVWDYRLRYRGAVEHLKPLKHARVRVTEKRKHLKPAKGNWKEEECVHRRSDRAQAQNRTERSTSLFQLDSRCRNH